MIGYIFKQTLNFIMDMLETIAFVGSIYMIIHFFILTPHKVKGQSMYPTFVDGEYILTSKITYKLRPMKRGDVIIIKRTDTPDQKLLIKRLIGLPGDEIMIQNGSVYINGEAIPENYLSATTPIPNVSYLKEGEPVLIPSGYVFVMGDNRPNSEDSRKFGPVPIQNIEGVVFFRYLPVDRAGWITNPLPEEFQSLKKIIFYSDINSFSNSFKNLLDSKRLPLS